MKAIVENGTARELTKYSLAALLKANGIVAAVGDDFEDAAEGLLDAVEGVRVADVVMPDEAQPEGSLRVFSIEDGAVVLSYVEQPAV